MLLLHSNCHNYVERNHQRSFSLAATGQLLSKVVCTML